MSALLNGPSRVQAPRVRWIGALALGLGLVFSGAAFADCQEDFAAFTKKRQAQVDGLNAVAKANKGKLDPIAACPKLRGLASVEREFHAYMVKNKEWCGIPDDALNGIKTAQARSQTMAGQACGLAAKVKQMQAQQAAGGGMQAPAPAKLPAGPL